MYVNHEVPRFYAICVTSFTGFIVRRKDRESETTRTPRESIKAAVGLYSCHQRLRCGKRENDF